MPCKDPAAYARSPKGIAARQRAQKRFIEKRRAGMALKFNTKSLQPLILKWAKS